jgi:hypothetical protein
MSSSVTRHQFAIHKLERETIFEFGMINDSMTEEMNKKEKDE